MGDDDAASRLADAKAAYLRGDFASARMLLRALLTSIDLSPDARTEAEKLLAGIRPLDRTVLALTVGCLAFFLIVFYSYVLR